MLPPNNQSSNYNITAVLAILAFILVIFIAFLYVAANYFGVALQFTVPRLNIAQNFRIMRSLPTALAVVLIVSFFYAIAYIIARKTTLSIVLWLDNRLLPKIKRMHSLENPIDEEAPIQNYWLGDPELEFAPTMATVVEFGTFTMVWGEMVLHQNPFFPGWKPKTLWKHFWSTIKQIVIIATVISILLLVAINFFTLSLASIILTISVIYGGILRYWAREWLRYSEFAIVTSERYIQAFGKFSWFGFILDRGYDVELLYNYSTRIDDVDPAVTPKKWGLPVNWLFGVFLKHWAESASRIGSVMVRRVARGGNDLFINYNFAPLLNDLLIQAKSISATIARDLSDIMQKKRDHIRGRPGERTNRNQKIREADEWAMKEIALLGYQPPQPFDVFEFKRKYLLMLAGQTPPPPTNPNPTQSTPIAYPGSSEEEISNNPITSPTLLLGPNVE